MPDESRESFDDLFKDLDETIETEAERLRRMHEAVQDGRRRNEKYQQDRDPASDED